MLLYRVLSAIVGIPVVLAAFWYGGLFLSALICIIAVLGVLEMGRLWRESDNQIWLPGSLIGAVLFVVSAHVVGPGVSGVALFITIAISVVYLIIKYPHVSFAGFSSTIFTAIYPGWLLTHLIGITQIEGGFHFVLLVLATTWSTDTFAYFVGTKFGRHKLAPALSPGKSVEGAVGGIAGSIAAALILGLVAGKIPLIHYITVGILAGIVGQAGDLLESAFKRMAGVKDSGRLIPGHGGMLDRFDSLLLTAPLVYYYLKLIIMN